jgi:hypothetical protein
LLLKSITPADDGRVNPLHQKVREARSSELGLVRCKMRAGNEG